MKRREFITLVGGVVAVGRSPLPRAVCRDAAARPIQTDDKA
jgi:hypothetical protein